MKKIIMLAVAISLLGCGGGGSGGADEPNTEVEKVENVGMLTVYEQLSDDVIGTYRTEEADITLYTDPSEFSVVTHGSDVIGRHMVSDDGYKLVIDNFVFSVYADKLVIFDNETGDVYSESHNTSKEIQEWVDFQSTINVARNQPLKQSDNVAPEGEYFRLFLEEPDLDTNRVWMPLTYADMSVTAKLGKNIAIPVTMDNLGDGFYRSDSPINYSFLNNGSDIGETVTDNLYSKIGTTCDGSQTATNLIIGQVAKFGMGRILKYIGVDSDNMFAKKVSSSVQNLIRNNIYAAFNYSETTPLDYVLCSQMGREKAEIISKTLIESGYVVSDMELYVNFYRHVKSEHHYTHSLSGGNVEHALKLYSPQSFTVEAKLSNPELTSELEYNELSQTYATVEKEFYQINSSIKEIRELIALHDAIEEQRGAEAAANFARLDFLIKSLNTEIDAFRQENETLLNDVKVDDTFTQKVPSGEEGVTDNVTVNLTIDIVGEDGSPTYSTHSSANVKAVFEEEEVELGHNCPKFGALSDNSLTLAEAISFCSSNGSTLPSIDDFEDIGASSSTDACGWPRNHYWTSNSNGTTQWAHNSAISAMSTVWTKDRAFGVVCIASSTPFVRTPIE